MERAEPGHDRYLAARSTALSMYRFTPPLMTALLSVLLVTVAQAQPAPGTSQPPPKASSGQGSAAAGSPQAGRALPHRMPHRVIMLHVDEVLAADTGEGIDVRLLPMGGRLEELFRYTTYHLISHQVGRAELGRTAAFTLPGGWIVNVEPNALHDN